MSDGLSEIALESCPLGHTQKAMECPGCAGVSVKDDRAWWSWYRTRTSSKDVREAVERELARG